MKKTLFPLFLILAGFLLSLGSVQGYDITYRGFDNSGTPLRVYSPSVRWTENCDFSITLNHSVGSITFPYILGIKYYSPDSDEVAYSNPPPYLSNITCRSMDTGIPGGSSLNDFYESYTETTFTSTSTPDGWTTISYDCDFDSNELFIYKDTAKKDSYGYYPFSYYLRTQTSCGSYPTDLSNDVNAVLNHINTGYYTSCGSQMNIDVQNAGSYTCNPPATTQYGINYWRMIPFNTGATGRVNITIDNDHFTEQIDAFCFSQSDLHRIVLWNYDTNSTELLGTSVPATYTKTLNPYEDYWLLIGTTARANKDAGGICTIKYNHTEWNMSIWAYEPDWECSDWSDCINGLEQRQCIDKNGIITQTRIETRSCFVTPTIDLRLGFEDYYEEDVWICQRDYWLLACPLRLDTFEAKYPLGWSVQSTIAGTVTQARLENFVEISQDVATEGSSSLKMWYVPPKPEEPLNIPPVTCGNLTQGRFPEVNTPYNESLFVAQNITFASPFFDIRFDVKKCLEPPIQYDLSGALISGIDCGKRCYGYNCTEEPKGRYGVRLVDFIPGGYTDYYNYDFIDWSLGNVTENVTTKDGIYTDFLVQDFSFDKYQNITLKNGDLFTNGTEINIYGDAIQVGETTVLTDITYSKIYANFTTVAPATWYNVTLSNIETPLSNIVITNSTGSSYIQIKYDYIEVKKFINTTTSNIILDYFGEAKSYWEYEKILDLSNRGLQTNHNYTLAVAVNPEDIYDSNSHCVYFDNLRITYRESALPECTSYCDGLDYKRAVLQEDGTCVFSTEVNSPMCVGDSDDRETIEDVLAGEGTVTNNSGCIDSDGDGLKDDLYIYYPEEGKSEILIDSETCITILEEGEVEANITRQISDTESAQNIFFQFILTPFFLFMTFSLIISGLLTGGIAKLGGSGNGLFQIFGVTMMIFILIGSAFNLIPIWITIIIVLGIALLLGNKLKEIASG